MSVNNFRKVKAKSQIESSCARKQSSRQKKDDGKQKGKKLFSIIQMFHNSLCSLPLNQLIPNNDAYKWLTQQNKTLFELQKKLKIYKNNPQSQYYKVKLQSVGVVLRNIKDNVEMLQKLKQQYSSSQTSNINSNSNSNSKVSQNSAMKESTVKDAFLCHKYEISTDKNLHNSSRFQFPTMVHTLRSENEEQVQVQTQMQMQDMYKKQIQKYNKSIQQIKTKRLKTIMTNDENSPNLMNTGKCMDSRNDRMLTVETLQKTNCALQNQNMRMQYERERQKQIHKYIRQIEVKNHKIEVLQSELRESEETLKQKNKQIEKILIYNSQMNEIIQLYKKENEEKNMGIGYSNQRIKILQEANTDKQNEIEQWKQRQRDLRETIKTQRYNTKMNAQQTSWKIDEQMQQIREMRTTIGQLSQEIKRIRNKHKTQEERLQSFKHKYYKLVSAHQLYTNSQIKKPSRLQQIHKIIDEHRKQLQSSSS